MLRGWLFLRGGLLLRSLLPGGLLLRSPLLRRLRGGRLLLPLHRLLAGGLPNASSSRRVFFFAAFFFETFFPVAFFFTAFVLRAAFFRLTCFFVACFLAVFFFADLLLAGGLPAGRLLPGRLLPQRWVACVPSSRCPPGAPPHRSAARNPPIRAAGPSRALSFRGSQTSFDPMNVVVKLFGAVRETVGAKVLTVEVPDGCPVAELRDRLAGEHPVFDQFGERLAVSVNYEIASLDAVLHEGDEVAFLPPVSGGAEASCTLSERPLDVGETIARVSGPGRGGIVIFLGAVRDESRGRSIRHLEYEAYPEMAEREMQKIADAAAERWPGVQLAIAHRAGHLAIGELAVVIAAAAPHRGDAFEACRFAIDTLKQTVPIWKKEVATDGEYWVDDRP